VQIWKVLSWRFSSCSPFPPPAMLSRRNSSTHGRALLTRTNYSWAPSINKKSDSFLRHAECLCSFFPSLDFVLCPRTGLPHPLKLRACFHRDRFNFLGSPLSQFPPLEEAARRCWVRLAGPGNGSDFVFLCQRPLLAVRRAGASLDVRAFQVLWTPSQLRNWAIA